MSMTIEQKLRRIRKSEGLTQIDFSRLSGIALSTVKNYERDGQRVGLSIINKITNHPRFKKYTLWLMTGDLTASTVQIAPRFLSGAKDDDQ